MFATLRSVSRMKRALRKSDRGNGPRLSIAVEIEEEEDYMSTFMWYGGNCAANSHSIENSNPLTVARIGKKTRLIRQ